MSKEPKITKPDFEALLSQATASERLVPMCLRGDLAAQLTELDRQLIQAQERALGSLAGANVAGLVDQIKALEAEMAGSTYNFRLRALPKREFRALIAAHPPRSVFSEETGELVAHPMDQHTGINGETFHDALIRACLVDPELDDEAWNQLEGKLNDRQYDELAQAAWAVNRSDVDVPFSRTASRLSQASEPE